jgi:hypothetical protein
MATKTPSTGNSLRSPVTVSRRTSPVTWPFPASLTSSTTAFHRKSIFGFANALSCMIFDARSALRR